MQPKNACSRSTGSPMPISQKHTLRSGLDIYPSQSANLCQFLGYTTGWPECYPFPVFQVLQCGRCPGVAEAMLSTYFTPWSVEVYLPGKARAGMTAEVLYPPMAGHLSLGRMEAFSKSEPVKKWVDRRNRRVSAPCRLFAALYLVSIEVSTGKQIHVRVNTIQLHSHS